MLTRPGPQPPDAKQFRHLCDCGVSLKTFRLPRDENDWVADHNRRHYDDPGQHDGPALGTDGRPDYRNRRPCAFVKACVDAYGQYRKERDAFEAKVAADTAAGVYSDDALDYIEYEWGERYGEISRDVRYLLGLLRQGHEARITP